MIQYEQAIVCSSRRILLFLSVWVLRFGVVTATLTGCFGESSDPTQASQVSRPPVIHLVKLIPDPLTRKEPVSVVVDATDVDRKPLTFTYQWMVNEQILPGETSNTLSPDRIRRGDRVSVSVVATNGTTNSTPVRTPPLTVVNAPPVVTLAAIDREPVRVGDRVQAKAEVRDADGEEVELSYRWHVNGVVHTETNENMLDTTDMKMGDSLQVEVVPRDARGSGQSMISPPVVVRSTAPKILSQPQTGMRDGKYEYAVQAADPEGEPLMFSLELAPQGMAIDKGTGHVTWQVSPQQAGTHKVRIIVQNRQGEAAFQEFELIVHPPTAS